MSEDPAELPEPPDDLPDYLIDGLQRQDIPKLTSLIEYAREIKQWHESVSVREKVLEQTHDDERIIEMQTDPTDTYADVLIMSDCNQDACSNCPHGPYVWRRWWTGNSLRKDYKGRPEDVPEEERVENMFGSASAEQTTPGQPEQEGETEVDSPFASPPTGGGSKKGTLPKGDSTEDGEPSTQDTSQTDLTDAGLQQPEGSNDNK